MFSSRQGFIFASAPAVVPADLLDLIGTGTVTEELGTLASEATSPFVSGQTVSANWTGSNRIKVSSYNPNWDNDWTWETWIKIDSLLGTDETKVVLSARPDGSSYSPMDLYVTNVSGYTDGNTRFRVLATSDNSSWETLISGIGTINLSAGTWYHVAVVKNGTSIKVWVDGAQDSSSSIGSSSMTLDPNYIFVGDFGSGGYSVSGNFSNLRFSNTARYTSSFTKPSAAFTDDGNTVFLMPFNET